MLPLAKLPLALHVAIESLAARSFIAQPQVQLPLAAKDAALRREADLILCNLGGALLATNLVAVVYILQPGAGLDRAGRLVALALASYHVWPSYRAYVRLAHARGGDGDRQGVPLGGSAVHLVVHLSCFVSLVLSGLFGGDTDV